MFPKKILINCSTKISNSKTLFSWNTPKGSNTGIKVYNCITKSKQNLVVKDKDKVTWYTCGPTVYDSSHVGHASSFVKFNIIQNILKTHFNLNLVTAMNITDIDDKIIRKALNTKTTVEDVAKRYEREFWLDLSALKVSRPDVVLRVSENIELILNFIEDLIVSGKAYKAKDGSIYFEVKQYETIYGKLQNIGESLEDKSKEAIKKSPMDFALWKSSKIGEPFWKSPWGPGRPGWHTECSALASYVFGSNLDIHAGGIDLRFPHHENEEVQCCAFHNTQQWVNYWLHTGHLHLKGSEKMSKSLGNTVTIQDMLKSTSPEVFRMACAMTHYRSPVEYSQELLQTAENKLRTYKNFINRSHNYVKGILKPNVNGDLLKGVLANLTNSVSDAFCDDFDTPKVIRTLDEVTSAVNSMLNSTSTSSNSDYLSTVVAISNVVSKTLDIFGVNEASKNEEQVLPEVLDVLINFRKDIRQKGLCEKNQDLLSLCDNVRNELLKLGITVQDFKGKAVWTKV